MSPAVRNPGLWLSAPPRAPPPYEQRAHRCSPRRAPPPPNPPPPPPPPPRRLAPAPAPRPGPAPNPGAAGPGAGGPGAGGGGRAGAGTGGRGGGGPRPRSPFSPRVPVRRAAVSEAREPLLELAAALTDPECDDPRGVALTSQLVCDGRSP